MTHSMKSNVVEAPFTPGVEVTGLIVHVDSSKGRYQLRLPQEAYGWLSIYEVSDREFDRLGLGSPVSGLVDRVEKDAEGYTHVVLKREPALANRIAT